MSRLSEIIARHIIVGHNPVTNQIGAAIDDEVSLKEDLIELLIYSPEDEALLSVDYLMHLHPEITEAEARSLLEFARQHTIYHKSCYGNGGVIYETWKNGPMTGIEGGEADNLKIVEKD